MRIISYNVNGLRAAISKGFPDWLKTDPADVICLQETKAQKENVDHKPFHDLGYSDYWFSAQKKGYSGVAVFTKIKPDHVQYGTGHKVSDDEGRVLQSPKSLKGLLKSQKREDGIKIIQTNFRFQKKTYNLKILFLKNKNGNIELLPFREWGHRLQYHN